MVCFRLKYRYLCLIVCLSRNLYYLSGYVGLEYMKIVGCEICFKSVKFLVFFIFD